MATVDFDLGPFLSDEALQRARIDPQLSNLIMKFAETAAQAAVGLSAPATHSEGDNVAPGRMAIAIQDESSVTAMQQYNLHMQGHGDLRAWLRKLLYRTQKPARDDLDLMLVPSCNASLDAFLHMLLDPGDSLLVEEHMYCAPLDTSILPRGCKPQPVSMDRVGITADGLEDTIERCIHATGHSPKLLYLVPNCQNPTGSTLTLQRKRDVYAVCQKHNIVILEDDPYALLQFPSEKSEGCNMPGLDVETGFLQVDTDGRVIRVDSFSKILAPGLRLAWVTTAKKNITHCLNASFSPTLGPSTMSQGLAYSILNAWGFEGFEKYIRSIQEVYHDRAKKLAGALERECGDRVVVQFPRGGMFLWVKFPEVEDTEELVDLMTTHKVALVPGRYFSPKGKGDTYKCKFARIAYSFLPSEMFDEGSRRVATMLEDYAKQRGISGGTTAADDHATVAAA